MKLYIYIYIKKYNRIKIKKWDNKNERQFFFLNSKSISHDFATIPHNIWYNKNKNRYFKNDWSNDFSKNWDYFALLFLSIYIYIL